MEILAICGFITGVLMSLNGKYLVIHQNSLGGHLQNPTMLLLGNVIGKFGVPLFIIYLFWEIGLYALVYVIGGLVGICVAAYLYARWRMQGNPGLIGICHFIGIMAVIPLILVILFLFFYI